VLSAPKTLIIRNWGSKEGALALWTLEVIKDLATAIDQGSDAISYETATLVQENRRGSPYMRDRAIILAPSIFKLNNLNEIEKHVRSHDPLLSVVENVTVAEKEQYLNRSNKEKVSTEPVIMPRFFEQAKKAALHGLRVYVWAHAKDI
jgi:hypothetical protein